MMEAQLPESVKDERLQRLQALLREQTETFNRAALGRVVPVLLEKPGRHPGQFVGRSPWLQAVHLQAPHAAIGEMVDARHELVFGIGPAGTGKTYLAVAMAVQMLLEGKVDRIVLSRPAVEAGERLGFLPGDMREKIDPYLRPLYDALYDMMPGDQVMKRMASGEIEIAPLAFMRGRTLANAFVILDEAQNTTPMQMKMFLTRLGEKAAWR
jgi:phosphate starvation-inducible protein PhoH and related proteins